MNPDSDASPCVKALAASQKGYVTVLTAVLVGVAFTASVVGAAAYIRGAQQQSVATRTQTQAQLKAWTGTEIVRQYLLQEIATGNLPALASAISSAPAGGSGVPLTFEGVSGISASLMSVDSATSPTFITARVVGSTLPGASTPPTTTQAMPQSAATSTLQVVYRIGNAANAGTFNAVLTFNRNLALGGQISVLAPAGSTVPYTINVLGDLSTGGNNITGVKVINSTGTINIGSGSAFEQLNSDCDVVISGSVTAASVNAQRNVCMTGAAAVSGTTLANGSVLSQAPLTSNGTVAAVANPTGVTACTAPGTAQNGTIAATCPVPALSGVDLSAGAAGASIVRTGGSVLLSSGQIGNLDASGDLTVSSAGAVTTGIVGGKVSMPVWNTLVNVKQVRNHRVSIIPASPITLSGYAFNANTLQPLANYAFAIDTNGFIQVTIKNVHGVADGTYFLGNYDFANIDFLCTALTPNSTPAAPMCQTPSLGASVRICQGFSPENTCFAYANNMWSINGKSMAPGVAFFQGDLTVGTGTYYNTFIATGNIATAGQHVTYAPNYAGYSGTSGGTQFAPTGICVNSFFPLLFPTQFCTIDTQTYNAQADGGVGNFAFLAGSWMGNTYPGQAGYIGGNVNIGASSHVFGSIMAGNEFVSGGGTTITGVVAALAQGPTVANSMGGSTTFDLTKLPPTFNLNNAVPTTTNGASAANSVFIQWARYL